MNLFLFLVWLQMSAQPQTGTNQFVPNPPANTIECWLDSETSDYMCKDAKGRQVDVTKALIKLMAADETDGKPPERDYLPNGVWPYTPKCPDGYRMGHYDAIRERWEGDCVLAEPNGKRNPNDIGPLPSYDDIPQSVIWNKAERVWCTAQTGCVNAKGEQVTPPHGMCPFGMECPAEPLDVPAVQEQQTYKTGESSCKAAPECEGKGWTCNIVICKDETATRPITTCADKSRILEHDGNSPPKYWCRKVQP